MFCCLNGDVTLCPRIIVGLRSGGVVGTTAGHSWSSYISLDQVCDDGAACKLDRGIWPLMIHVVSAVKAKLALCR